MGDVERHAAAATTRYSAQRVRRSTRTQRCRSRNEPYARPASAQARGERPAAEVAPEDAREQRAEDPDRAPAGHLPRRERALAEEDVRRQRADGADDEAGRAAEDVAREQDDVGRRLDARDRRERDAAERGERGERRDEREELRRRPRALVPREAGGERDREHGEGGELPAVTGAPATVVMRARSRSAPSSGSSAPSTIRAVSVAKYQPPLSSSAVGPSAIGAAVGEQHDAVGDERGELGVVRRDEHGAARRAAAARRSAARSPLAARSMPRVGSSRHSAAGGAAPAQTIASARRWRSPPERSRGWRSASAVSPAASSAVGVDLVADAVGEEVVVGVLQQQRDAPRRARPSRASARAARWRGAAASTCPRRCAP